MNVKRFINSGVQVVLITAISLLFSKTTIYNFTSIPAMNSSMAGVDFKMSDIYNSVICKMTAPRHSKDITIVSVDDCSREEIAEVIRTVDACAPSAVGLDIIYGKHKKNDGELIASIRDCKNMVLPKRIIDQLHQVDQSGPEEGYFYDGSFSHFGILNLESRDLSYPVRAFRPLYWQADSTLAYGMATELVRLARPEAFDRLMEHISDPSDSLLIKYPNLTFDTIDGQEILARPDSLDSLLRGRIVLIGKFFDGHDLHLTPIDRTMPGAKIQAYIIESILGEKFLVEFPPRQNWKIAMIMCALLLSFNFVAIYHFPIVGKMAVRMVQIGSLFLCDIVGIAIYYYHGVYIDFIPTLTMIALGFFSYDIWVGIVSILQHFISRAQARKAAKLVPRGNA